MFVRKCCRDFWRNIRVVKSTDYLMVIIALTNEKVTSPQIRIYIYTGSFICMTEQRACIALPLHLNKSGLIRINTSLCTLSLFREQYFAIRHYSKGGVGDVTKAHPPAQTRLRMSAWNINTKASFIVMVTVRDGELQRRADFTKKIKKRRRRVIFKRDISLLNHGRFYRIWRKEF